MSLWGGLGSQTCLDHLCLIGQIQMIMNGKMIQMTKKNKHFKIKEVPVPTSDSQVFLNNIQKYLEKSLRSAFLDIVSGNDADIAVNQIYSTIKIANIIKAHNIKVELSYSELYKSLKQWETGDENFDDDPQKIGNR